MSHARNKSAHHSTSILFHKRKAAIKGRSNSSDRYINQNTTMESLMEQPTHKIRPNTSQQTAYNSNVHVFRDIFNSNDTSQLPFMASLRKHLRSKKQPQNTISDAFAVSTKTTCNQQMRKRVSDFKGPSRRLSTSYYRWHNTTGRNTLWSTNFECTLRTYNENPSQSHYNNLIKPIVYKDTQKRIYQKSEMICDKYKRSFSLK